MAEPKNFDKFKDEVYKSLGLPDVLDNEKTKEILKNTNTGCFPTLMKTIFEPMIFFGNRSAREKYKISEKNRKADELLAQDKFRKHLLKNLEPATVIALEAAVQLTPVLYETVLEDEEKLPLDALLFAVICRKIVEKSR